MSKFQKSLDLLTAAAKNLPAGFQLETAKNLIQRTITEIQKVEKTKNKKLEQKAQKENPSPKDKWHQNISELIRQNTYPKLTLNHLDVLLKQEQDRLDKKKQLPNDDPNIMLKD